MQDCRFTQQSRLSDVVVIWYLCSRRTARRMAKMTGPCLQFFWDVRPQPTSDKKLARRLETTDSYLFIHHSGFSFEVLKWPLVSVNPKTANFKRSSLSFHWTSRVWKLFPQTFPRKSASCLKLTLPPKCPSS